MFLRALLIGCMLLYLFPSTGTGQIFSNQKNQTVSNSSYPIDSCITYTFKLAQGDNNNQVHINDILSTSSGFSYHVGHSTINGNQRDALLQQFSLTGQLIWSKTLGLTNQQGTIRQIAQLPNRNLVMVGTITQGLIDRPFILSTDPDGNILWMKSILTNSTFKGAAIVTTADGRIGMAASDDSVIVYARFDSNGNLVWMKRLQPLKDSLALAGIKQFDSNRWFIGYAGIDTARRVSGVLFIDGTNGNLSSHHRFGGASVNTDVIFHQIQRSPNVATVTGIVSMNNAPYSLFKLIVDPIAGGNFTLFNAPGINLGVFSTSSISEGTETIVFKERSSSDNIYVFQYFANGNNKYFFWKKRFTGFGSFQPSTVKRNEDGGYYIASNGFLQIANSLLKLDSAGRLPACPGTDFEISAERNSSSLGIRLNNLILPTNYAIQSETGALQITSITGSYTCLELSCPPKTQDDTCKSSFFRVFRSNSFADGAHEVSVNKGNEILVSGHTGGPGLYNIIKASTVNLFNEEGKLVNRKKISIGNQSIFTKQTALADGSFLIGGFAEYNNTSHLSLAKISNTLSVIWNKYIPLESFSNNGFRRDLYRIMESSDGSVFIWYNEEFNLNINELNLIKLDAAGNFIWRKIIHFNFILVTTHASAIQDDQFIYTVSPASPGRTLITKIDKGNGNLVWSKYLTVPGYEANLVYKIELLRNNLILFGSINIGTQQKTAVVVMDKDAIVINAKTFEYNTGPLALSMLVTRNNDVVLTGFVFDHTIQPSGGFNSFIRLDESLNVKFSKRIFNSQPGIPFSIAEAADGGIVETGNYNYLSGYLEELYLKKYGFDGMMGNCISENFSYTIGAVNVNLIAEPIVQTDHQSSFVSIPFFEDEYSLQQHHLVCSSPPVCLVPKISGADRVCYGLDTVEYKVVKNNICTAPISWEYDPGRVEIIHRSDSLLRLRFLSTGVTRIAAKLFSACQWLKDSIDVSVDQPSSTINLGRDTSFCEGDSIVLDAGVGFQTYKWSTGVSTQSIGVNKPGSYSVLATDPNGCRAYDTIVVLPLFALPNIGLPNDSLLCLGENKILNAGSGYKNYLWHDGSGSPTFTVSDTGTYWVQITDNNNCTAADTTTISRLLLPPEDFLPVDTTICTYGKLTIIPDGTFNSYTWSNGSTGASIVIDKAGVYSLIVKDQNGCNGTDEITITHKDCLTGFYIPNAFSPNRDRNNETFKPLLFGNVKQYRFTIYNRYGQRVFETTELGKGWDGTVAGLQQNSGTYVWTCTYQFENETVKTEKGTVILIR